MTQALRLLCGPDSQPLSRELLPSSASSASSFSIQEKLAPTEPPTYSSNGTDTFLAPAAYRSLRAAWVHVFPEACCHQGPHTSLRYFKWGISRLVLEPDPAPLFIPMFVDGTQGVMPEDRGWPRWVPRAGNTIRVAIGKPVSVDDIFREQRQKWRELVSQASQGDGADVLETSEEAKQLRVEVAKIVRDEVQKLRVGMGLPAEEDDSAALAETWSQEPNKRRFKSPVDGSLVNRH